MATPTEALPGAWAAAFARERDGSNAGPDPSIERRAARLLAAFIAAGLFFLALPGTLIGVGNLLLIAMERTPTAPRVGWIQAHGQVQLLGWVGSFMLGIALYLLPKLRSRPIRSLALGWLAWVVWTAGIYLRWQAGTAGDFAHTLLISAALCEFVGFALVQLLLWLPAARRGPGRPPAAVTILAAAGFTGLGLALVVNLLASWFAPPFSGALAARWDRIVVTLELWTFVLPVALGFSSHLVGVASGLRKSHFGWKHLYWLCAGVAAIAITALLDLGLGAQLIALAVAIVGVWALRILEAGDRPAKREGVYGAFPAFIRLAYIWLLAGATLGVAAALLPTHPGLGGSSRHAVTVGFVALLIFSVGPRILPKFLNGRTLFSTSLMALSLWLLTGGCLLRVITEAAAYGSLNSWAWMWLPISAYIELVAILLFAINLAATLLRPRPVWFRPETITADTCLYWYTASFPRTRKLLVRSGLTTLSRARSVPRTLTLAEAAAADGIAVETLTLRLQEYFRSRRQARP